MQQRTQRAVSLGWKVGLIMAAIGFMRGVAGALEPRIGWVERVGDVVLVPAASAASSAS